MRKILLQVLKIKIIQYRRGEPRVRPDVRMVILNLMTLRVTRDGRIITILTICQGYFLTVSNYIKKEGATKL